MLNMFSDLSILLRLSAVSEWKSENNLPRNTAFFDCDFDSSQISLFNGQSKN